MTRSRLFNRSALAATLSAGAVAFLSAADASAALRHTHVSVLVEEFTATWCGPCNPAFYSLERLKARWGDQVAILTYNIADELTTPYNTRRQNEVGVGAIPYFFFQGTFRQLGVPPDSTMDYYVAQSQNVARDARVIGHWDCNPTTDLLYVDLKIQADQVLASTDQLRVVVYENNWLYNAANGLTQYDFKVQGGFDEPINSLGIGQQLEFHRTYNLSTNQYLRNWDEVGVTVFLYNTTTRRVRASWELGAVSLGDLNGDVSINRADAAAFRRAFGSHSGQTRFNSAGDYDRDDDIDNADRQAFIQYIQNGGMR